MASRGKKVARRLAAGDVSDASKMLALSTDDDDFVSAGSSPVTKEQPGNPTFSILSHRSTPKTLVDAIEKMTDMQKQAVYEMGFGSIFRLSARELPCRLAHWCVSSFKARTSTFVLPNGREIHITDEDVWLTLGFPRGDVDIIRNASFARNKLIDNWAVSLGKKKREILPSDVLSAMLSDKAGGSTFRKNFLILVEFCIIEGPAESHVRPKILDYLDDLGNVPKLNWSKYLLTTLMHCHESWTSSNRGKFSGSVLFLMIFYVDRVEVMGRSVRRDFPTVSWWMSNDLMKRQSCEIKHGFFGEGFLAERFNPSDGEVRRICFGDEVFTDGGADPATDPMDPSAYANKVINVAKQMTDGLSTLIDLLSNAPPAVSGSPCFRIAVDACKHLFNVKCVDSTGTDASDATSDVDDGPPMTQQMADECSEWDNPEWEQWLVDMMVVWEKRQNANVGASQDMPSFSIGLTQKFGRVDESPIEKASGGVSDGNMVPPTVEVQHATRVGLHMQEKTHVACPSSDTTNNPPPNVRNHPSPDPPVDDRELEEEAGPGVELCVIGGKITPIIVDKSAKSKTPKPVIKPIDEVSPFTPDERQMLKGKGKVDMMKPPQNRPKKSEAVAANVVGKQTRQISTRGPANTKISSILASPYTIREVPVSLRLSKDERIIFHWILSAATVGGCSFVFESKSTKLTFNEVRTMRPGSYVACGVLNSWSTFLNRREYLKAPGTYSRFYFTTLPVMNTIVDRQAKWNQKKAFEVFVDRLDSELQNLDEGQSIETIDLVFFPIWQDDHFYVICFNFRGKNIVILDNSDAVDDQPLSTKYKATPTGLFKFFMAYLKIREMTSKTKDMEMGSIERMKMHWRNTTNRRDCAIYAMRHMEVYKGERVNGWRIGLPKDKDHTRQLQYLRAQYSAVLLCAACNKEAQKIGRHATLHYEEWVRNGWEVVVEDVLDNYVEQ